MRNNFEAEVRSLFSLAKKKLRVDEACAEQLELCILDYSVTSREHPRFLEEILARSGSVKELHAEVERNLDEERGVPGDKPHYQLFKHGLEETLGLNVMGFKPSSSTQRYVETMLLFAGSDNPSVLCGTLLAAEACAVEELILMRRMTDRYLKLTDGASIAAKCSLSKFYDLHLGGVEQLHRDNLGDMSHNSTFDQDVVQASFLATINIMRIWWHGMATWSWGGAV